MHDKWECILKVYKDEVMKNVPRLTGQVTRKKDYFNMRCEITKRKRDTACNKWRKRRNKRISEEYRLGKTDYVKIRREEENVKGILKRNVNPKFL